MIDRNHYDGMKKSTQLKILLCARTAPDCPLEVTLSAPMCPYSTGLSARGNIERFYVPVQHRIVRSR